MRVALVISLFLLSWSIRAQDQHVIDSLKSVIKEAKHDTSVCDAYISWGEQVYMSNPDTALILWQLAHGIAERNLTADPLTNLLKKTYLSSLGSVLGNIGYIYWQQGDIPRALEYYDKCLGIFKETSNQKGIASALENIGYIYSQQGDFAKALEYYDQGLELDEETDNKYGEAAALSNIAGIYKDQGDILKALKYHQKSLKIREEIGDKDGISTCLNNIGNIYHNQGDTLKALEYHQKSLKMSEELGNKAGIAMTLNNLGHIELWIASVETTDINWGALTRARENGMRGLLIAREIGSPDLISHNSGLLSKVAKKKGNYKEALEMYELHIQMRDSIKNEQTQKATIRQQTKYEFEKAQLVKEQEEKEAARVQTEETSRRDNMQYSVILIALLILGAGVLALGRVSVSPRVAEGLIFFSFLILFEFLLVLADPHIEGWSGGAPGIKLLFNAGIAALIFPAHAFFESRLKKRLVKA